MHKQVYTVNKPIHFQDLISNSPYSLPYTSYNDTLENLVWCYQAIIRWGWAQYHELSALRSKLSAEAEYWGR